MLPQNSRRDVQEGRNNGLSTQHTRQNFLKAIGCSVAWVALASLLGCKQKQARSSHAPPAQPENDVWRFRSRPDLGPPAVEVTTQADEVASGYIFVAPKRGFLAPKRGVGQDGPMIVDGGGQPVWFYSLQDKGKSATDFKVQYYKGRPVLTWWEGRVVAGHGLGEYVIFDGSYREIAWVRAGNSLRGTCTSSSSPRRTPRS